MVSLQRKTVLIVDDQSTARGVLRRMLERAVELAAKLAKPGDVVLLSPGGTSFDAFRDFAERGETFKNLVMQL